MPILKLVISRTIHVFCKSYFQDFTRFDPQKYVTSFESYLTIDAKRDEKVQKILNSPWNIFQKKGNCKNGIFNQRILSFGTSLALSQNKSKSYSFSENQRGKKEHGEKQRRRIILVNEIQKLDITEEPTQKKDENSMFHVQTNVYMCVLLLAALTRHLFFFISLSQYSLFCYCCWYVSAVAILQSHILMYHVRTYIHIWVEIWRHPKKKQSATKEAGHLHHIAFIIRIIFTMASLQW